MDTNQKHPRLVSALRDARTLLAHPENNFQWSGWENGEAALKEIDELIARLEIGELPERNDLAFLFAPTGPIQEVSVSSGWGDEFLWVAIRYDAAAAFTYA